MQPENEPRPLSRKHQERHQQDGGKMSEPAREVDDMGYECDGVLTCA